ncbi:copper transporter [Demequina sp.]|uniref:copper transporter n=1 Tax=Demequina sp. TaxID=2050685 RepID=UPI003D120860
MTGRSRVLVAALAVFALAVGLLLGSGVLGSGFLANSSDGDKLAEAEREAEAAQGEAQLGHDFADATGPVAIRARLEGRTVALVRTADTTDEDLAAASARLEQAGAVTGSTVALTDEWTAEDRGAFRDALADQITDALPEPPQGATTSQVLSAALAQALASGGAFDPEGQERADTLWTLLTEAELVTGERTATAEVFLLVTPGGDVSDLAGAFVDTSVATVVGFTGADAGSAGSATTVTRAATFYGAWTVVGATINAAGGISGAYDASDAADVIANLN